MWEIIAAILLCLFALVGFVAFVKMLIFKIYKPKTENAYIVLDAQENPDDLEYVLRCWEARARWLIKDNAYCIIIVDKGLSNEQRKICRFMCRESEIFKLCTPTELYRIFQKKNT